MNKPLVDNNLNLLPGSQEYKKQVPWQFGQNQKIQTKQIKLSKANINSTHIDRTGVFASGTFADGGTLFLFSKAQFTSPHANEPIMGVPYIGVFLGTSANGNAQIYPNLGTANGTQFPLQGGLDFQSFSSNVASWKGYVINHSGAPGTVGLNATWQLLWFNNGTVT